METQSGLGELLKESFKQKLAGATDSLVPLKERMTELPTKRQLKMLQTTRVRMRGSNSQQSLKELTTLATKQSFELSARKTAFDMNRTMGPFHHVKKSTKLAMTISE